MPMIVGILTFELHLPAARSLKEKRKVVKAMIDRIHARLRVSVAETDFHDLHQRAQISVAVITNGHADLDRLLSALRRIADAEHEAMVTRWEPQVLEAQ